MSSQRQAAVLAFFACFFVPILMGLYVLSLGQDANWDLRNYHFYSPYAWLHDRLDMDVAPAHHATFYNPTLYIPFYYAVVSWPPKVVAVGLGLLQGLNFIPLFFIARSLLSAESPRSRVLYATVLGVVGLLGAANLSEVGTMFSDNIVSLLVLSALFMMVRFFTVLHRASLLKSLGVVIVAGVLAGAAGGLKQPAALYAIGLCAACLVIPTLWWRRLSLAFVFGIGTLGGFAATGGWWLWELWQRFGNPLFPYYNQTFKSPMAALAPYVDSRFVPKTWIEALLRPFEIIINPFAAAEVPFRDLRFAILYVLGLMMLSLVILRRNREVLSPVRRYVLIMCAVSYLFWLKQFAIYRYLTTLEMLAPLAIWILLQGIFSSKQWVKEMGIAVLAIVVVTLQPANWGHVAWGKTYFGVTPPVIESPEKAMVLMTGLEPMAYVIPFFPPSIPFLRIQGYFTAPSETPNGYDRVMQARIRSHEGPLYVLYRDHEQPDTDTALAAYGLVQDHEKCQPLDPHVDSQVDGVLNFCPVQKK